MTNLRQLEQNVIKSFELVKDDVTSMHAYLDTVYAEIRKLRVRNAQLEAKVAAINVKLARKKGQSVARKVRKTAKHFVASKTGTKFHSKDCAFAKNIKPKNKQTFARKETALNNGLKGCSCVA